MNDNISCVILTKDEKENLKRCLRSVADLGEVVIVDDYSVEGVNDLVRRSQEKLFQRKFDNITNQRMFGASHATKKWILFLDADECVTKSGLDEIDMIIKQNKKSYYSLPRENVVLGKILKHGNWYPDYQLRLMRKDNVIFQPQGEEVGKLEIPLKHYSHQDVSQWCKKYWRATSIEAKTRRNLNPSSLLRSLNDVCYRLVRCRGYKDGFIGIITIFYLPVFELTIMLKFISKRLWRV